MTPEKLRHAQTIETTIYELTESRKRFNKLVSEFINYPQRNFGPSIDTSALVTEAASDALSVFEKKMSDEIDRLTEEFQKL